jgi:hypothetical protein
MQVHIKEQGKTLACVRAGFLAAGEQIEGYRVEWIENEVMPQGQIRAAGFDLGSVTWSNHLTSRGSEPSWAEQSSPSLSADVPSLEG